MSVPSGALAFRALRDREALRAALRRAAGKLRDMQRIAADLADVIDEVESALDMSAWGG